MSKGGPPIVPLLFSCFLREIRQKENKVNFEKKQTEKGGNKQQQYLNPKMLFLFLCVASLVSMQKS